LNDLLNDIMEAFN